MLEQLLVELEYPFTANCAKCMGILFEIRLIDQFIRARKDSKGSHSTQEDAAKFYLLHPGLLPSTFQIQKNSFLSNQQPFFMQLLSEIKCGSCKQRIGVKMLTVSSDFHYPELLDRLFVQVSRVRIRTQKEDVTEQVRARFLEEWDEETEGDSIQLSEMMKRTDLNPKKQQNKKPPSPHEPPKPNPEKPPNQTEHQQLKYLRKQLQKQSEQNKETIHEIVSSIDFFNQVLTRLEKRVSQTENVCNVLKEKVEKIIPLLRRKNQGVD